PGGDTATLIAEGTNITTTQTIYVFAQTGTVPNCSSEASFTVTVNPTPVPDAPADVVACDSYILPALSVGDYYSGPGASGTAYFAGDEITAGMTMYVYAETGTTPNCWAENSFEIGIFFSPVIGDPTPYPLCDDNNDGFSCFDLHSKDAEITGGAPNLVVTYHETQTDAQNGVNAIATNPYCNILPGMQTLYVRVADVAAPACASFTTLELIVNPVPVANPSIPAYRLCDVNDSGDDTEGFILSSWDAQVSGGAAGVVVSYHLSLADAQAGVGAIDPNVPYQNISNPQQICARIEYPSSGCYDTGCFDLMVDPLPQAFGPAPVNLCSGLVPGQAEFNLSANDAQASGGIPGRIVSYHLTLAD